MTLNIDFEVFVSNRGTSDVQETIDAYNIKSSAYFSRAIYHLADTPIHQWQEPQFKKLKFKYDLYEIRYKANNCATRALGCFHPQKNCFIITLICTHKENVYDPHDALNTAHLRFERVIDGTCPTKTLRIDGEEVSSI